MLDDMAMRKLAPLTQKGYLRSVIKFTRFFGRSPDLATPEDLRAFQLHMVDQGDSPMTWTYFSFVDTSPLDQSDLREAPSQL
jgi:hypothetical protein